MAVPAELIQEQNIGIWRDLLPVSDFCALYNRSIKTVYSWKARHPHLIGVVIFTPPDTEMHISISGYEKWIRGELNQKTNGHEAQKPTAKTSRSNSNSQAKKATPTKPSRGAIPQLT